MFASIVIIRVATGTIRLITREWPDNGFIITGVTGITGY